MVVGVMLDVMIRETSEKEQENHHHALVTQIAELQAQIARLSGKIDASHKASSQGKE